MSTRTCVPNIWSSFIYSFFSARPFDEKLGSSLIYFIYLQKIIRQKYMIFFVFFILSLCRTIRPKIESSLIIIYFFICTRPFDKLGVTLTLLFILFLDVPIFPLLYSWQILPLNFHCSVSGSTAFKFRPLRL